ncbi:MAG: leucine-rich repeat domain-containing protein [Ruminococcus flavefaciens]|nr:leucine-rich repeat domain-containing protein [Ruminococcus flavefaciens]
MKRKILAAILFAAAATAGVFALSGCQTNSESHAHTLVHNGAVAATCTQDGNKEYWHCSGCGKNYRDENGSSEIAEVTLNSLGHEFVDYIADENATCTNDGTATAACEHEGCRETKTISVPYTKLAHSFTNYVSNDNATCTKNATKTAKCDNCTATDTKEIENSKLAHSFTNYVSNDNATCTKNATKTAKCDNCTATDTKEIENSKLAHSFTNYVSNDNATCTKNATKTAKCDNCTATDTKEIENSKLAHSFTNYVSNDNATCTKNATKTAKCDSCTATDTKEIENSKLAHSFTNYVDDRNSTCVNIGTKTAKCDNCTATDSKPQIGPHKYGSNAECENCGSTQTVLQLSDDGSYYTVIGVHENFSGSVVTIPDSENGIPVKQIKFIHTHEGSLDNDDRCYEKVIINKSAEYINANAFISLEHFYNDNKCYIDVDKDSENFTVKDGVIFTKDMKTLVWYNHTKSQTAYAIPEGVEEIGDYAFQSSRSLTNVTLPATLVRIGQGAFNAAPITGIHIGKNVAEIARRAFYSTAIAEITVDSQNASYKSVEGCLFTGDGKQLINYTVNSSRTEYSVPEGVEEICEAAFNGANNLLTVHLPDSVKIIGERAFSSCNYLTNLNIPDGIQSIGRYAFNSCPKELFITEGNLRYLGNENNPHLAILATVGSGSEFTVHTDTKIIIANIYLPDDAVLNYGGTWEQFASIIKSDGWAEKDFTVVCTDGTYDKDGSKIG